MPASPVIIAFMSQTSPTAPASAPANASACARYPMLLADIGGTHVRLALRDGPDQPVRHHRKFATADFDSLADVIAAWAADIDRRVDPEVDPTVDSDFDPQAGPGGAGADRPPFARAVVALAAPLEDGPIRLTNEDFVIDAAEVARRFAPCRVHLMNDFEAQAWSLPTLGEGDYRLLGPKAPAGNRTMAVLGPGTGLGCAGLIRTPAGRWLPLAGEGGHMTLAAQTPLEAEVIAVARREYPHISAERFVSGTGLPLLYRSLAIVRGETADPAQDTGEEIGKAIGTSALAAATIDLFGALLGGFAGNVALVMGARGGVWIAGGIAPALYDALAASPFRARFEDKGRFRPYLEAIGTAVVTRPDPALDGMAFALESGGLDEGPASG